MACVNPGFGAASGLRWNATFSSNLRPTGRTVAITIAGGSLLLAASSRVLKAAASGGAAADSKQHSLFERFPIKAAVTAGGLALTGDTIAQVMERWRRREASKKQQEEQIAALEEKAATSCCAKRQLDKLRSEPLPEESHDWVRALRMASYGFLLYGPLSQLWYQFLERRVPGTKPLNLALKVAANQLMLGPCVLLVVFAWNFAWMGRAKEIPDKYRRDLFPSLVDGWKFWIPASLVNFGVVPLSGRVAFMSSCSVFWNFYLSSSVGKDIAPVVQAASS